MKTTKRFLAMVLTLIMVMSLATTAFAAEKNDSITINSAKIGETYTLYKMFDLVVDNEETPTKFSYTITAGWEPFFTEDGAGAQYITAENGYITDISDAAALAKAAANWRDKPGALKTMEAASETVVFDGLENGYYLITSTLGTVAMTETTPDKSAVTITEKNPVDTIVKEVKEDSTDKYDEKNDAQVGDTVEFKSEATLNPHTTNVKIHDTMDSGLTYNNDVKIYTSYNAETKEFSDELEAKYYTVQSTPDTGDTFTISFTQEYLDSLNGATTLYLKYTAVLNEGAVVKDANGVEIKDQNNKTKITYGEKQSVEDQTVTTTHKVTVDKNAEGVENLADAVFKLKKDGEVVKLIKLDELNYRVAKSDEDDAVDTFITVATGDIVIWGLDTDDDYTLEEIAAPSGYNNLSEDVAITVNADNSTKIDVENKAGTELPSTGGVGTTLFYVFGAILVLGAVILLVTKRRMDMME